MKAIENKQFFCPEDKFGKCLLERGIYLFWVKKVEGSFASSDRVVMLKA